MTTDKRVFLTLAILFFLFMHWVGWYETSLFALTRAIVEEGKTEITSFARETGDWMRIGDSYYIPQAPGTSLLMVPIHVFSVLVFSTERPAENKNILIGGESGRDFVLPTHLSPAERFSMVMATFLLSGLLTVATAYLLFIFSKEFIADRKIQYLIPIGYALGTLAFSQAIVLQGHAVATFFAFASFFIGYYTVKKDYLLPLQGGVLAGIMAGLAFLINYPALFVAAGIGLWFLMSRSMKTFLWYSVAFIAVVILLLIYNTIVFGTPFFISYATFLPEAEAGEIKKAGELFLEWMVDAYFTLDFLKFRIANIFRLLFMPERGIFLYSPFLFLAVPGISFLFIRRSALVVMVLVIFFLFLWFMTLITWWGGSSFGPRHLTLVMPFLMIPIMVAMKRIHVAIVIFLIAASMLINILGLQPPAGLYQEIASMDAEEYYKAMTSLTVISNPLADYYWPKFKKNGINMPIISSTLIGKPLDIRSYIYFNEQDFFLFTTPLGNLFASRLIMPFFIIVFTLSFVWFGCLKNNFWKYLLIITIVVLAIFSFRLG